MYQGAPGFVAASDIMIYSSLLCGAPTFEPLETGSFPAKPPHSWTDVPSMVGRCRVTLG